MSDEKGRTARRGVGERPVERNEVEARQGVRGHNVWRVLVIGLALVVLGFALVAWVLR